MTPQQVEALKAAFQTEFHAEVDAEQVNSQGRYRFAVVSPQFEQMTQLQRQDGLWKLVDQTLPRDATLDISLILAFAPSELVETGEPI
jgi:stress-induced morphogen